MDYPFASYRSMFPSLINTIQLSSCSQSALAIPVSNAIKEYMESLKVDGMNWEIWMQKVNEAKAKFAQLINAASDEIAVVSCVSEGISAVATALSYDQQRNEIVTTDIDFPCVGHVYLAQQRAGAKVTYIPTTQDYSIPLEYYEDYITEKTILTSVSHVSYYNGFKQDLRAIAEIAHKRNSLLLVDAYQSVGNIPIDVKQMDVDILVAGAQKYMLGIPGIAFLYMKKETAARFHPKVTGWFGQEDPFAFDHRNLIFAGGTRRFELGTPPVINAYAAGAALDILLQVGMENIDHYLQELSLFAISYAQEKGLTVISPLFSERKGSNTAIKVGDGNKVELMMKEKGIVLSARQDVIRIAPHFYNCKDEVQYAIDELEKSLAKL